MFTVPENIRRIVLLILNGAFVLSGVIMVGLGIYRSATSSKQPKSVIVEDNQTSGITSIVVGCLQVIVGVCGIVGTVLNHRILLMVNAVLLGICLLGNLIALVVLGISTGQVTAVAHDDIKVAIENNYGNSDETGREFTLGIDDSHRSESCCGWSGLDGENFFLKSPWYKNFNTNVTDEDKFTLPDSCCEKRGPECTKAKNVKQARDNGFVLKRDCMDKIIGAAQFFLYSNIVDLAVTVLMQIACVFLSVITLMQEA